VDGLEIELGPFPAQAGKGISSPAFALGTCRFRIEDVRLHASGRGFFGEADRRYSPGAAGNFRLRTEQKKNGNDRGGSWPGAAARLEQAVSRPLSAVSLQTTESDLDVKGDAEDDRK